MITGKKSGDECIIIRESLAWKTRDKSFRMEDFLDELVEIRCVVTIDIIVTESVERYEYNVGRFSGLTPTLQWEYEEQY